MPKMNVGFLLGEENQPTSLFWSYIYGKAPPHIASLAGYTKSTSFQTKIWTWLYPVKEAMTSLSWRRVPQCPLLFPRNCQAAWHKSGFCLVPLPISPSLFVTPLSSFQGPLNHPKAPTYLQEEVQETLARALVTKTEESPTQLQ